jgi:hypothetical protein
MGVGEAGSVRGAKPGGFPSSRPLRVGHLVFCPDDSATHGAQGAVTRLEPDALGLVM